MKPTINDIAVASGFSCSTVSRVLNNSPHICPETKAKVEKVIKELNYRPNRIARALVKGKINVVSLIIGDIRNPFYAEQTKAAEEVLNKAGYMVVLCDSDYMPTKEEKYIETAIEYGFAGVIMVTAMETKTLVGLLRKVNCPVVLVNRYLNDLDTDVVSVDNYQGGYIATRHLIDLGHRNIAILAGPENSTASSDRARGFLDAMREAGLEPKEMMHGDLRTSAGYNFGRYLLEEARKVTAVFCGNDLMANGLVEAFIEQGKVIPDDLSVVGYDDSPVALNGKVKLTTIHLPYQDMGKEAAKLVIDRITNASEPFRRIIFQPKLVVRASTKQI